ncbi:MAG: hypothetical protein IIA14_15585, partial [SAR324 cluster bacterium]|nr:hypothetical protein [SAR324 cluster bacterium]
YREAYKRDKIITAIIDTLWEKTRQNFKIGQFKLQNTFLVINLSLIPPFRTENIVLRPAYVDTYLFPKAVTGQLWMLAFGKPGMLIHGIPDFEGKRCIEGIMEKEGILIDAEFNDVEGMLIMVHPWGKPSELWGLFRRADYIKWREQAPEILETLLPLICDNWNDDVDSNGWCLPRIKKESTG